MNKIQKLTGICVLIPVLLSGCGQPAAQSAAPASSTQPAQSQDQKQAANGSEQNKPQMNQAKFQMFGTFQTLIQMDKADGLAITKDQATAMLPVAQDIESKGELSDDNKTKLLEKLTDTQKKFIDDAASRMSNRGAGRNGNGPGGGNNGGGKNANAADAAKSPDASAKPDASNADGSNQASQGQGQSGQQGQKGQGRNGNGGGNNGGNRPAGEMKDPGKQLIELLQSKVK